jgi:exonuclease VII small subunit
MRKSEAQRREAEHYFDEARTEMRALTKELERAIERLETAIDRIESNGR